jgi:hypothetical protein
MHITSNYNQIKNHDNLNMHIKNGTREFKPIYSCRDELRKGMNIGPRNSLLRTRQLSMNLIMLRCERLDIYSQRKLSKHIVTSSWID